MLGLVFCRNWTIPATPNAFCSLGHHLPLRLGCGPSLDACSICTSLLSITLDLCYSQILTSSTFISINCSGASQARAQLYFFLLIILLTPAGSQPARLSWEIASNDFIRTIYTELFKEDISLNTNQWTSFSQYCTIPLLAPCDMLVLQSAAGPNLHVSHSI